MLTLGLSITLRQCFRPKYYTGTIFRLKVSMCKDLGCSSIGKTMTRDLCLRSAVTTCSSKDFLTTETQAVKLIERIQTMKHSGWEYRKQTFIYLDRKTRWLFTEFIEKLAASDSTSCIFEYRTLLGYKQNNFSRWKRCPWASRELNSVFKYSIIESESL